MPLSKKYDAVIVGSGPNGLSAGIALLKAGLSVLILEGKETVGGGMRTLEVTLPGYKHDICSAIHPLGVDSPFFNELPLKEHGLKWIFPEFGAAHPFDDDTAAVLHNSIEITAGSLRKDKDAYKEMMQPFVDDWDVLAAQLLGPLKFPDTPLKLTKFAFSALQSASGLTRRKFKDKYARALFAGMAAHSMLPLNWVSTSSIAFVLMILGHKKGWAIPKGGSQSIADALASYFRSLGGDIQVNYPVKRMADIPETKVVLFNLTPRQLVNIAGDKLPWLYRKRLERYRYGQGTFKIDWALDAPIPWKSEECKRAGTVHIGPHLEDIEASEKAIWNEKHVEKPFIIVAQQSLFDPSRAPEGKHTGWGYCHVPAGSTVDMTARIENQIERFAPGFKDLILERRTWNSADMEVYNPNYVGGDINGGAQDVFQIWSRPIFSFSPYKASAKGIYLASSATPPGGGVHGMCGYHAAQRVLKDMGIDKR